MKNPKLYALHHSTRRNVNRGAFVSNSYLHGTLEEENGFDLFNANAEAFSFFFKSDRLMLIPIILSNGKTKTVLAFVGEDEDGFNKNQVIVLNVDDLEGLEYIYENFKLMPSFPNNSKQKELEELCPEMVKKIKEYSEKMEDRNNLKRREEIFATAERYRAADAAREKMKRILEKRGLK